MIGKCSLVVWKEGVEIETRTYGKDHKVEPQLQKLTGWNPVVAITVAIRGMVAESVALTR